MQSTKGLKLEVRLSAYIDGEVNEAERSEIEQLIARDDEARMLMDMLKAGSTFGNTAFEGFLHDPVPLALVRQIKQGSPAIPKPERVARPASKPARVQFWPRALAASVALLILGGSTGFLIGRNSDDTPPSSQWTAARTWLDDIADYHRIYSRQQAHLVEVPASDAVAMESWLATSVGVNFRLPDLTGNGLAFEGGRLLVSSGKPVAQLIYKNEDGDVFAICFLKSAPGDANGAMTESMRDDLSMISWQKGDASYVVIGPSADAHLKQIADTVLTSI